MPEPDDQQLLNEFTRTNSEAAFAALVARYIALVYSSALRFAGNPQAAEEISQAVFIILARKAPGLRRGVVLSGWLYQTARLTAANYVKHEIRRQRREQEAYMQSTLNEPDAPAWEDIGPLLDEAMGKLGETDRNAVVLQFFENKTAREVAAALKMSEAAAHKRVHRALEKLRGFLAKRGVVSSATIIAGAVAANSVHAAPVGLANTISTAALAKGAAVSTSTLTLVKGVLKIMAWTKAKTAMVIGIGILIAATATTTVTVKQIAEHRADDSWRAKPWFYSSVLDRAKPQVIILPSKFQFGARGEANGRWMGFAATPEEIVAEAWGYDSERTVSLMKASRKRYDYIASLPSGNREALQQQIKKQFGLTAHVETVETNVLLLEVISPNAPGLVTGRTGAGSNWSSTDNMLKCENGTIEGLAGSLESYYRIPVIDQTHLEGIYDINIKWRNLNDLKQVLPNQLGLELVPGQAPVQYLFVEKAN